jgi:hypothetical protein
MNFTQRINHLLYRIRGTAPDDLELRDWCEELAELAGGLSDRLDRIEAKVDAMANAKGAE